MKTRIYAAPAVKGLRPLAKQGQVYLRRGRGALVDRLTASPAMHASRVIASLILSYKWGFQRNILVPRFSMWLGDHVNGGN